MTTAICEAAKRSSAAERRKIFARRGAAEGMLFHRGAAGRFSSAAERWKILWPHPIGVSVLSNLSYFYFGSGCSYRQSSFDFGGILVAFGSRCIFKHFVWFRPKGKHSSFGCDEYIRSIMMGQGKIKLGGMKCYRRYSKMEED